MTGVRAGSDGTLDGVVGAEVTPSAAGVIAQAVTGAADGALANAPGSSPENPVLVGSIEEAMALRAGHEAGQGPWVKITGPSPWVGYPKDDPR